MKISNTEVFDRTGINGNLAARKKNYNFVFKTKNVDIRLLLVNCPCTV